tara:strand:- start:827 stop:1321 length:495 start_codon:yes stop_codon:yes gene_type:complete
MAEQPQTIVEPAAPTDKPYGARSQSNLQSIYPGSPILNGDITDDERKETYQAEALDGNVANGLGFNTFNRDYAQNGAPDFDDVETGGGGKPATAFVPNPSSPGPGSTSASDQPEFQGEITNSAPEYGSGLGGTQSPSTTSTEIEKQTLGSYISGESYAGSDGQA